MFVFEILKAFLAIIFVQLSMEIDTKGSFITM
jgi:hypothetical protein